MSSVNNAQYSTMKMSRNYRFPIMAVLSQATSLTPQSVEVSFPEGDKFEYFKNDYSWDYSRSSSENFAKAVKLAIEKYDEQNDTEYHKWHYQQIPLPCGSFIFAQYERNNLELSMGQLLIEPN